MPQPIGCCVLLLNSQNQVLLGKRKNGYKAGQYGMPGGRIDVGEPLLTGAAREVAEETGLEIKDLEYGGVVRENQGEYDFIHFVFATKNVTQTPTNTEPDKCEGWEWHELSNIPEAILPGHKAAIELYQNQEGLVDLV